MSSAEKENVFGRHQRLLCFSFLCLCFSSCFVKEILYFFSRSNRNKESVGRGQRGRETLACPSTVPGLLLLQLL